MFNKIYVNIKKFILENIRFLIVLSILVFVFTYELPFVVYTPGGLVNLEKRIDVEDEVIKKGSINMSYVSMRKGTLPTILLSFVIPNWDIKKSEDVTLSDSSVEELLELEKIYMASSVDIATILAYQKAGKSINVTKTHNYVSYIADFANTSVLVKDEIISVDGENVTSIKALQELVSKKDTGSKLNIVVKRDGKEKSCYAYVTSFQDVKKIGISFVTTYEYDADPKISVKTKASESGSSGGLMLTLAIYNDLSSDDLTKGRTVVGTGTILLDGTVGAIDGVKYKMLGAAKNDADIFLIPEENYDEALKIKEEFDLKFKLKSIKNFDEAVSYLLNN